MNPTKTKWNLSCHSETENCCPHVMMYGHFVTFDSNCNMSYILWPLYCTTVGTTVSVTVWMTPAWFYCQCSCSGFMMFLVLLFIYIFKIDTFCMLQAARKGEPSKDTSCQSCFHQARCCCRRSRAKRNGSWETLLDKVDLVSFTMVKLGFFDCSHTGVQI